METAHLLITLGGLFLAGLAADQIGRATQLPRVTMLLALGLIAGQSGFGLLPAGVYEWFETLSTIALTMVAFLLGSSLSVENLAKHGRAIVAISMSVALVTLAIVTAGLFMAGLTLGLALILGAIATSTAPAAMADVIRQSGLKNSFTDTLKGIVAIDDVWGLMIFSVAIALVAQSSGWSGFANGVAHELGGGVLLGCVIGIPAAFVTGRISPGEPLQAEAIGIVFLTAGFALWFQVSFLIAAMTVGACIQNFAKHHDRAFHEIENIQWPFMILFFLLAGASLETEALLSLGWVGASYLILRSIARIVGGAVGVRIARAPKRLAFLYGPALLPQAGVAVGMGLVAAEKFPHWGPSIMAVVIASTVVFELIGPPITQQMIRQAARNNGS